MAPTEDRPLSALPSTRARALAFAAIVVAGGAGGLIGSSFVSLQCDDCTTATGVGAVVGALTAAAGVAVVAVLVLRAMGEWRRLAPVDDGSGAPGSGSGGRSGGGPGSAGGGPAATGPEGRTEEELSP